MTTFESSQRPPFYCTNTLFPGSYLQACSHPEDSPGLTIKRVPDVLLRLTALACALPSPLPAW